MDLKSQKIDKLLNIFTVQFIEKQFTFTINGLILLILLVIVGLIILGLLAYVYKLTRQVKEYERPKFGFLGKPIYPLVAVAALVGGAFFVNYNLPNQSIINIEASETVDIEISKQIVFKGSDKITVRFEATPYIDTVPYGDKEESFDIFWSIEGEDFEDMLEFNKSVDNQSGFTKDLSPGNYKINVTVVFKGKTYTFTDNLILQ